MLDSWNELEAKVTVKGERKLFTSDQCKEAATRLQLPDFPPSYCEYVKRFGFGEWENDLNIYVPSDPSMAMSLDSIAENERSIVKQWLSDDTGRSMLVDRERMSRLIGFGSWSSGFSLCWDPEGRDQNGEMPLFLVAYPEVCRPCGRNLLDFLLYYWVGGKINDVYKFAENGTWENRPIFKSWSPPKQQSWV